MKNREHEREQIQVYSLVCQVVIARLVLFIVPDRHVLIQILLWWHPLCYAEYMQLNARCESCMHYSASSCTLLIDKVGARILTCLHDMLNGA